MLIPFFVSLLTTHAAALPAAEAAAVEPCLVDVSESALRQWSYDFDAPVHISADLKAALVDWTEDDARRADTGDELDAEMRLDNLLAQAAGAARKVRAGTGSELFLAEYFDRAKRGNPRRARLAVRYVSEGVVIDFP